MERGGGTVRWREEEARSEGEARSEEEARSQRGGEEEEGRTLVCRVVGEAKKVLPHERLGKLLEHVLEEEADGDTRGGEHKR